MASPAVNQPPEAIPVETDEMYVSTEDAQRMFDEAARRIAGISGAEFIRRYDAGEYAAIPDDAEHRLIIELSLFVDSGR